MQQAVLDAVGKVHGEADEEPDDEPDPGNGGESRNQEDAGGNAEKRYDRAQRYFKCAMSGRGLDAQDDNTETDQYERE